jgi:FKBP-type peptidyl-prolyl cis-trans isomerase 2
LTEISENTDRKDQKIAPAKFGDLVNVNFTCKLEDDTVYDSSFGKESIEFTIGENSYMPGFERSVIGMNPGERKTTRVMAVDAYGPCNEDLVKVINRSEFPNNLQPEVGLQIQIQRNDGVKSYVTIIKVDESSVTLDGNHPLAGKDLIFDIELIEIRKPGPDASKHYAMGVILQDHNQHEEAISHYTKAIQIKPDFVEAYYNLGVSFQHLGQIDKAIQCYEQTVALNPEYASAHLNLGIALKEQQKYEQAIQSFEKALQIKPDYTMAYYHIGNTLFYKGQFEEAQKFYKKAVSLNPEYADAHWNIALINLLLGNFAEGWKGYEWRWKLEGVTVQRDISQPLWDGSDITGKSILIYTEQGFGDIIQFIRYIPLLAERGAKVILECPIELIPLLQNIQCIDKIFPNGSQLPEFDLYCPLLSLPRIFDTGLENIPSKIPYIQINTSLVQKWHERINTNSAQLKIGLAWAGSPDLLKPYYNRSCPLELFSILGHHDVIFYSLQKGEDSLVFKKPPEEITLVDYMGEIEDFADTAALIENLDLVISIDTSVAHLAGALGKPVWTLLPFVPDWRWLIDREDSPWYPTMRLFRQPSPGDWQSVMDRVAQALKELRTKI